MQYPRMSFTALAFGLGFAIATSSAAIAGSGGTPVTDAPYGKTYGAAGDLRPTEFIDVSQKVTATSPDLGQLMQSFKQPAQSHAKRQTY